MAVRHPAPKLGWFPTVAAYGGGALLMLGATRWMIPTLVMRGWAPPLAWFFSGGTAFLALFVAALVLLRLEGADRWHDVIQRVRFRPVDRLDVALILVVGIGTVAVTAFWAALLSVVWPGFEPQPWFLRTDALTGTGHAMLLAWAPMFLLNVFGEELLWHGWLLPGQERVFGRMAWLPAGIGWILFHGVFGLGVALLFAPFLLIVSYAVRRVHNLWIGVWLHAVFNAFGIMATLMGLAG
jgi:membrane protease YdiL (CAAX protease family)